MVEASHSGLFRSYQAHHPLSQVPLTEFHSSAHPGLVGVDLAIPWVESAPREAKTREIDHHTRWKNLNRWKEEALSGRLLILKLRKFLPSQPIPVGCDLPVEYVVVLGSAPGHPARWDSQLCSAPRVPSGWRLCPARAEGIAVVRRKHRIMAMRRSFCGEVLWISMDLLSPRGWLCWNRRCE